MVSGILGRSLARYSHDSRGLSLAGRVEPRLLQAYFLHTPVPKSTLFVTRRKNSAEIEPWGASRVKGHHRPVSVPRNKTFCRTRDHVAVNNIGRTRSA